MALATRRGVEPREGRACGEGVFDFGDALALVGGAALCLTAALLAILCGTALWHGRSPRDTSLFRLSI